MNQSRDEFYLKKCFELAVKGKGLVSPNPMVGSVVVKGNRVVGYGWHRAFGLAHAEVEALKMAGTKAKNATLYVNLEPCCHYGKTPPCTDAIIQAGIKKVVFSTIDPNPAVNGKSIEILKQNGIEVRYGLCEKESHQLNESYFTFVKKKRPFISLKWAMSIDGKIADACGRSRWITSDDARQFARQLRFEYDAIIVGSNTIVYDNPYLDFCVPCGIRKSLVERKKFYKIILDTNLKVVPESNVFLNKASNVIIFTAHDTSINTKYHENVEIIPVDKDQEGLLDLSQILNCLYEKGIAKLFVEGGTKILTSFYHHKIFDLIYVFIGCKIIGGSADYPPLKGNIISPDSQSDIILKDVIRFSNDVLLIIKKCSQE
jgi:diaminohydroxyphosphoribosylaminopyrimidine deaminase/5-amino-6-(5-phosphoribosylamino)uracil reductase